MTLSFYAPPPSPSPEHEDGTVSASDAVAYKAADAQHRRSLPDEWLAKRSAYRSLLLTACQSLKVLDGLKISKGQRERAHELVDRFTAV